MPHGRLRGVSLFNMTVLGIDPGTSITGYAVLKETPQGAALVTAGAIRPHPQANAKKLKEIRAALVRLIDIHRPDIISLEKIFFSKNIRTALSVAEARGVILLTAEEKQIRISEYTPPEVKMAVTGYGKADKRQVKEMMRLILRPKTMPALDDITDAMAIAFTALRTRIALSKNI